jgi:hypothetical protein
MSGRTARERSVGHEEGIMDAFLARPQRRPRWLAALLAMAFFALVLPAAARAAQADTAPPILAQWGTHGSGNGQFGHPAGLAIDGVGEVYVSDQTNNRVQVFTPDGAYLTQWGTFGVGHGQFGGIQRLAVGLAGDVFVCDWNTSRVQRFTAAGAWVNEWVIGTYENPWGVAADSAGNVYVADRTKFSVQKYTSSGDLLREWGTHGTGPAQFGDLTGVAVSLSGHVFTCDGGNSRITEFSADGDVLKQWASPRTSGDPGPFAIAVDRSGRVYAVTHSSSYQRVLVFTPDGDLLTQWDVTGAGALWDIAVDATGDVYVADSQNFWVRKYGSVTAGRDTTPPVTTVSGADKKWHNDSVTLTWTAIDNPGGSGVAYTEARYTDPMVIPSGWSDWVRLWFPEITIVAADDHSDDGKNLAQFRSGDVAGNVEVAKQVTVLIDTTPPTVVAVLKADAVRGHRAVIDFKVTDKLSPKMQVEAVVSDSAGRKVRRASSGWLRIKRLNDLSFNCDLKPGAYTTAIMARDLASNWSPQVKGKLIVR